ncbi:MAG: transglutaminase domain-containing protein [Limisphaerales bacterium]
MKTPPLLLLATLLFWGWQSGFLIFGAIMGVILESARLIRLRWDLTADDFRRIWNFCVLLALALIIYTFSTNGAGGFTNSSVAEATRNLGASATIFLRWLPMTLFLFIAAQTFNERESIPLAAISFFARRAQQLNATPERHVDISYPYFMLCLFSAGVHVNEGTHSYFWGQAALIAWALWPLRSRRFGPMAWVGVLAAGILLGLSGQHGLGELQRLINGYNAQWMASMMRHRTDVSQSMTALGQIGKIKLSPQIVIRLETKNGSAPPGYLREASYRNYHPQKQTWYSGGSRNDFADISHAAGNEASWILLPGKTNTSAVNIACYLEGWSQDLSVPEGLLSLPTGSGRLENVPLDVASIKTNSTGAMLASGPGLMIFDALYGPGATIDSPPDNSTNHLDMIVPTNEAPALEKIISELNISGASEEQKLMAMQQFFAEKFSYSLWLGPDKVARTNETALSRFLLQSRSGHCEYFATATVLLLRELGIPARYAVGYAVHEPSSHGYVVRERDAHAWCLVWNEQAQAWEDFDTTPASWVATENSRASATQWLSDGWSWIKFQIAKFRWGQTSLRKYLLWALVPVLTFLLYRIIFRRKRKRRTKLKTSSSGEVTAWPGLDSEFFALERRLAARGMPRLPSEPMVGWLKRALSDPALADLRNPLKELLRLHYAYRFDPHGISVEQRKALALKTRICLDAMSQLARPSGAATLK